MIEFSRRDRNVMYSDFTNHFISKFIYFIIFYLACSLCHSLLQDEVHLLREQIVLFKRTIQNSSRTADLITDRSFPKLLTNLSTTVLRVMAQVNSSYQLENNLHQDFQNLGQVLYKLQSTLSDNISLDINTVRAQSSSFVSLGNQTRDTMVTIYDFLWMSVYVINADVIPRSSESTLLLHKLQEAADNFTAIADQRITSYAPVLLGVRHLFNSTNFIISQTNELVNITSLDINTTLLNTTTVQVDIYNALIQQKMSFEDLYNRSLEISISFNTLLKKISNTSGQIENDLNVNTTYSSIIKTLSTTNTTLHDDMIALQSRLHVAQQSYSDVYNVSMKFLNDSTTISQNVNSTAEFSQQLHEQVQQIYEGMRNATLVANHTFNTANKMLNILLDYQSAINNSTKSLQNSLDQLKKV